MGSIAKNTSLNKKTAIDLKEQCPPTFSISDVYVNAARCSTFISCVGAICAAIAHTLEVGSKEGHANLFEK